jgi:hypothetical protein
MIGVETLITIQIGWVVQASSRQFATFFTNFQALNISYGQISFVSQGELLTTPFGNLGFTTSFNYNYLLYAIINGIVIIFYVCVHIFRYMFK